MYSEREWWHTIHLSYTETQLNRSHQVAILLLVFACRVPGAVHPEAKIITTTSQSDRHWQVRGFPLRRAQRNKELVTPSEPLGYV